MAPTYESRRTVFRQITQESYIDWPAYESTPLFDRSSLAAVEADVRVVADIWFQQEAHEAVEPFVATLPLSYVKFDAHDRYTGSTSYEMETLFRLFLLKECHDWDHETALVEYLTKHPDLCDQLGLESVPDQSTLWRSWNHRFTAELQDAVETAARTILIKAQNADASVPRKPERQSRRYDTENTESDPSDQTALEQAETVTEQVRRVAFPVFSLDRARAVRSMRTPTGISRPISGFEGTLPSTKALGASSTSPIGSGRRSATATASKYATFPSNRFGRCTDRR